VSYNDINAKWHVHRAEVATRRDILYNFIFESPGYKTRHAQQDLSKTQANEKSGIFSCSEKCSSLLGDDYEESMINLLSTNTHHSLSL
jgi:hypothetical protein